MLNFSHFHVGPNTCHTFHTHTQFLLYVNNLHRFNVMSFSLFARHNPSAGLFAPYCLWIFTVILITLLVVLTHIVVSKSHLIPFLNVIACCSCYVCIDLLCAHIVFHSLVALCVLTVVPLVPVYWSHICGRDHTQHSQRVPVLLSLTSHMLVHCCVWSFCHFDYRTVCTLSLRTHHSLHILLPLSLMLQLLTHSHPTHKETSHTTVITPCTIPTHCTPPELEFWELDFERFSSTYQHTCGVAVVTVQCGRVMWYYCDVIQIKSHHTHSHTLLLLFSHNNNNTHNYHTHNDNNNTHTNITH